MMSSAEELFISVPPVPALTLLRFPLFLYSALSRAKEGSGDKIRPDGGGEGVKEEVMNEPTMETLARRLDRVGREMEGKRGR